MYLRDKKPDISFANHLDLFWGWVEEWENPLQWTIRELQEELNIHIDPSELNFIETVYWDIVKYNIYLYEISVSLVDKVVLWEWQEMRRYSLEEIQLLKLVSWYKKYFLQLSK